MPCYQVQKVSVEFKATHADLLKKAIYALGWNCIVNGDWIITGPVNQAFTIDLAAGRATVNQGQQPLLNELKRAYSEQAVKLAAKLGGWRVQSQTATKGLLLKGVL